MPTPGYIPGPLVIPGVIEVILRWALPNGKLVSNVLHGENLGPVPVDPALAQALFAGIVGDAAWTTYAAHIATTAALQRVDVRDLNVALAPLFESTGAAAAGTDAFFPVPEGVALVATLKAAIAGRSGRGRVYLPGFGVDNVDAQGHAIAGLTGDAVGFVQLVSDQIFAAGMFMTIATRAHAAYVSPATGLMVPALAAGSNRVTQITVEDNVFDSQRRRK